MSQITLHKKLKSVTLPVMEAFDTLQGEGFHSGRSAYFIRLGGCDVGCHWCDVKESWNAEEHPAQSIAEIIENAGKSSAEVVVITGGEPLMYDLTELTIQLQSLGKSVHVETSGAHPISGNWDWICFSPKKFKPAHKEFFRYSDELKVVIYHKSDLEWAEQLSQQMDQSVNFFLQPEWSKKDQMTALIVEYIKQNPKWRISLQTHKYLGIP